MTRLELAISLCEIRSLNAAICDTRRFLFYA